MGASAASEQLRILVVDDDATNLFVLRHLLTEEGFDVVTATDGLGALEIVPTGVALVLLDLSMPGMNGFEVVARLDADEDLPRPPVVAVTAHVTRETREACQRAGFDGFLEKPLDLQLVISTVRRLIGAR